MVLLLKPAIQETRYVGLTFQPSKGIVFKDPPGNHSCYCGFVPLAAAVAGDGEMHLPPAFTSTPLRSTVTMSRQQTIACISIPVHLYILTLEHTTSSHDISVVA